ncbi:MAG: VOC family protein [Cellvibrionaceae bacterium]
MTNDLSKQHEKINYVEFPVSNMDASKQFFNTVFDWAFEDYGEDYAAFLNAGIDGGFYRSEQVVSTKNGSALVVFYSKALEATQEKIEKAGGNIIEPIFSFPGGRRFHFSDPSGNEYAVWSDH